MTWLAMAALAPAPLSAGELIVSREGDAVAVYFRMPLKDVPDLFGQELQVLMNDQGQVDFENVFEGTYEAADTLVQDIRFSLGGEEVAFEAMSMMAHQTDEPLPFSNPIEALIAMAVCSVEAPEGGLEPDQMVWIGGFYAYPVKANQDLTITFPETNRGAQDFSVMSFDGGKWIETQEINLEDGATLNATVPSLWRRLLSWG